MTTSDDRQETAERPCASATDATAMGRTARRKLVSYGTGAWRCNCGARFTGTDCRRAEYEVVDER